MRWYSLLLSALVGLVGGSAELAAASGATGMDVRNGHTAQAELVMAVQLRDNYRAFSLYMLHCAGCHRANGRGVPDHGVPSFVDSAAMFTWLPAGRQYLIRVPGSADSTLTDSELAEVLNWIVATYSPRQLPPYFKPYTKAEVAAVRDRHYKDVVVARARVDKQLAVVGLSPARYTFGRGDKAAVASGH